MALLPMNSSDFLHLEWGYRQGPGPRILMDLMKQLYSITGF